jgi:hypothetical protein
VTTHPNVDNVVPEPGDINDILFKNKLLWNTLSTPDGLTHFGTTLPAIDFAYINKLLLIGGVGSVVILFNNIVVSVPVNANCLVLVLYVNVVSSVYIPDVPAKIIEF